MKIYINNILIKAEILPSNTPTLDETLETFSFDLISNDNPMPYAPMQEVRIDFLGDESEVVRFVLTSDNVDIFSTNPLRYKHNMVCTQYDRKLSKHLVRDTVITQPAKPKKESFNSAYFAMHFYTQPNPELIPNRYEPIGYNDTIATLNAVSKPLALSSREKVKSIKVMFELKVCNGLLPHDSVSWTNFLWDESIKTQADFKIPVYPSNVYATFLDHIQCRYKDSGGTQTINIYPSDLGLADFVFNQEIECPLLKSLLDAGAYEIELLFDGVPIQIFNATELSTPEGINLEIALGYFMTIKIVAETYYYSAYDVLNLLLQRQKKETSLKSSSPLFTLPSSGELHQLLTTTIAPNFTFTQSTMYECVADVFRLFDAIFRIGTNDVIEIEYFNDLSKEEIAQATFSGRNTSISEDKYANGLVSYYQDARINDVFPTESYFGHIRSPEFGVALENDHSVIVNYPIDSLDSFKVKVPVPVLYGSALGGFPLYNYPTNLLTVDLVSRVVEQNIWSNLPSQELADSASYDNFNLIQITSFFFTKGDNKINISYSAKEHVWIITTTKYSFTQAIITQLSLMANIRYYRKYQLLANSYYSVNPTPNWKNILIQATYKASVSGVTKVESVVNKYDGELLADQYNGSVDLNKMGINMLGLSLKLGNPILNCSHKITRWQNRIKVGQIYRWQNAMWIANVCSYTFLKNGVIKGSISFVQNFNQLSLRTQLLREKRMSNISQELISKSEEIITDYVYYMSGKAPLTIVGDTIHFSASYLPNFISDSFSLTINEESYSIKEVVVNYVESGGNGTGIYIPMVKYGSGNTINFEMTFNHPVSAGNKTNAVSGAWFGSSDYYTSSVNYTDEEGFLNETTIRCFPVSAQTKDRNFPEMSYGLPTSYIFRIPNYKVYKQPNEIFALNYQLAFLPYPSRENTDFIGTKFINNNAFVKKLKGLKNCSVYLFGKEHKFSQIDTKLSIDASYVTSRVISAINIFTTSYNSFIFDFVFNNVISTSNVASTKSWCVVDEENDVLFASNSTIDDISKVTISFTPRLNRI